MKQRFPLVSILIPTYNRSGFIRETLNSVLNQTYKNWECIVVDDHSSDDTWQILEEYICKDSRFKIYKRPLSRLKGGNASRNFAFEQSQGEYINWLDSDDIMDTDFLKKKVEILENDLNLDFVIGNIKKFSFEIANSSYFPNLDLSQKNIDFPLAYIKGNYWIQTALPLFRRKFLFGFEKHFDENIMWGQETEFFIRLLLQNPNFEFCQDTFLFYREHNDSYTSVHKNFSIAEKYEMSYLSDKLIFSAFLNADRINKESIGFFKNVFNDRLLFLSFNSKNFWDLLWFGTKYNLFKGRFQGIKIVGIKILKLVKII